MKRVLVAIIAGVVLVTYAAFGQTVTPTTQGKVVQMGRVDAGTLPAARLGGILYDVIDQRVLVSDGGTWVPLCQ